MNSRRWWGLDWESAHLWNKEMFVPVKCPIMLLCAALNCACSSVASLSSTANTPTPNYWRHSSARLLLLHPLQLLCHRYSSHITTLQYNFLSAKVNSSFKVGPKTGLIMLIIHLASVLFVLTKCHFSFSTTTLLISCSLTSCFFPQELDLSGQSTLAWLLPPAPSSPKLPRQRPAQQAPASSPVRPALILHIYFSLVSVKLNA